MTRVTEGLTGQAHRHMNVKNNQGILLVDRSIKFNPAVMAIPAFDNRDGGKWSSSDTCSQAVLANSEFVIDRIRLEKISTSQKSLYLELDAMVPQSFLKQKDRIPNEWIPEDGPDLDCIVFSGTTLINTFDQQCYLVLRYMGGQWHRDCFPVYDILNRTDYKRFRIAMYSF